MANLRVTLTKVVERDAGGIEEEQRDSPGVKKKQSHCPLGKSPSYR